ncbi:MAG: hypothetical protein M1831_005217 [Alyxoria varia]|nr:MAG: hypothetical protein M1831_005217 [Alyxoria varia]
MYSELALLTTFAVAVAAASADTTQSGPATLPLPNYDDLRRDNCNNEVDKAPPIDLLKSLYETVKKEKIGKRIPSPDEGACTVFAEDASVPEGPRFSLCLSEAPDNIPIEAQPILDWLAQIVDGPKCNPKLLQEGWNVGGEFAIPGVDGRYLLIDRHDMVPDPGAGVTPQ